MDEENQQQGKEDTLSRFERKKLKKQQFKNEQGSVRSSQGKNKFIKNAIFVSLFIIIFGGLGYYYFMNSGPVIPTIDNDPSLGSDSAIITIIEFGDYQCPFTQHFNSGVFKEIMQEYDGKVKWVFKDMVTGKHLYSTESSIAANCAQDQGKYWEYHDLLFKRKLADVTSLKNYAKELQLDLEKFNTCYESRSYADEIKNDYKQGVNAGVTITPTFFIFKGDSVAKMQGDLDKSALSSYLNELLEGE